MSLGTAYVLWRIAHLPKTINHAYALWEWLIARERGFVV